MAKKNIKIEGSKFASLNGIYRESDVLVNEKKQFLLDAEGNVQKIEWHSGHGQWQIVSSGGLAMVVSNVDTESPEDDSNVWVVDMDNSGDPSNVELTLVEFPDFTISEAGTEIVNKTFTILTVVDNKPSYVRADTHQSKDGIDIKFNGELNKWEILGKPDYDGGTVPHYYESIEDVLTPDLATKWSLVEGASPSPVFSLKTAVLGFIDYMCKAVRRSRG